MPARPVSQLGIDERRFDDAVVENALELRQKERESLSAARMRFEEAHKSAEAALERLELPTGAVARVGRFRIERRHIPPRSVAFESKATDRIRITVPSED